MSNQATQFKIGDTSWLFEDLTGQTFGRWYVEKRAKNSPTGKARYHVKCVCGTKKVVSAQWLRNGQSKSCGCYAKALNRELHLVHHHACRKKITPEYRAWQRIKMECYNPNLPEYARRGALGIEVKFESFQHFLDTVGLKPSDQHYLTRKDFDEHFTPENCEWKQRPRKKGRA
jgi:hypothetical protein